MWLSVYKSPFYQIVESSRIEKSIRQRESNRIEFSPNRNALRRGSWKCRTGKCRTWKCSIMTGGGNAGPQMQDHVKRQQTFEVCFNEQTRKTTGVARVTSQHCRVTRLRWVSYGLLALQRVQKKSKPLFDQNFKCCQ